MDINGLGEKMIKRLVQSGLVKSPADLYKLTPFDLAQLGSGIREKTIRNFYKELEKSRRKPLHKLLAGLGIPGVGVKLARDLAEHFRNLDALQKATIDQLLEVPGIGLELAKNIVEFFNLPEIKEEIEQLKKEVNTSELSSKKEEVLKGKKFVLTGTLKNFTRKEAEELIVSLGGKVSSSVSKNTDFVIVGENPGSKLQKAKALNVKTITEEEFIKLIREVGEK